MTAMEVYAASDGKLTTEMYRRLETLGPEGIMAVNLFRAQKCSERAKVYRGRRFRDAAYDRKQWSMDNLAAALTEHGDALGFVWGWKQDPSVVFDGEPSWVMYIDVPGIGQVSFHSPMRGKGPDYAGEWDGRHGMSVQRVIDYAQRGLGGYAQ